MHATVSNDTRPPMVKDIIPGMTGLSPQETLIGQDALITTNDEDKIPGELQLQIMATTVASPPIPTMDETIDIPYWIMGDTHPYGPTFVEYISLRDNHPTLGLQITDDLRIIGCIPGTAAHNIPRWKVFLRKAKIFALQDERIHTLEELQTRIQQLKHHPTLVKCKMTFTTDIAFPFNHEEYPQLYFDQIKHIITQLHEIKYDTPLQWNEEDLIVNKLTDHKKMPKLTRRYLQKTP